jgi:hypothetical protein
MNQALYAHMNNKRKMKKKKKWDQSQSLTCAQWCKPQVICVFHFHLQYLIQSSAHIFKVQTITIIILPMKIQNILARAQTSLNKKKAIKVKEKNI